MKRHAGAEFTPGNPTYKQIVRWKPTREEIALKRRAEQEHTQIQRVLFIGHIPRAKMDNRYPDTTENRNAQRSAIWQSLDEFYAKHEGKMIELSLCSGAAGGDLDIVEWVKNRRKGDPEKGMAPATNLYISAQLPLLIEGFRQYSVDWGFQKDVKPDGWNALYDWMVDPANKDFIFVHEPYAVPFGIRELFFSNRERLRKHFADSKGAKARSSAINGPENERQFLIDTLNKLVTEALEDGKAGISPQVLLVDYGGEPQGSAGGTRGGTSEALAKLLGAKVPESQIKFVQAGLNVYAEGFQLLDDSEVVLQRYVTKYRGDNELPAQPDVPASDEELAAMKDLARNNRESYIRQAKDKAVEYLTEENATFFRPYGPRFSRWGSRN